MGVRLSGAQFVEQERQMNSRWQLAFEEAQTKGVPVDLIVS
jgi:hypothetical protein